MATPPMAESTNTKFPENQTNPIEYEKLSQECKQILPTLPEAKGWVNPYMYLYQDTWYTLVRLPPVLSFQKHFQAKDSDIIIASLPKAGTTWLKALTFAIMNRNRFSPSKNNNNHPLLISNSHELVPHLEIQLYASEQIPDLSNMSEPRIFGTHVPFLSLPDSVIKSSRCKIVYICRNPFDHFVSTWFFFNKLQAPSLSKLSLEEGFERYCKGVVEYGPFWTNILSFWRGSKENPNKVLFLKYEDLKGNTKLYLKKVAEFLNCPFDLGEEESGIIENIIELCSFEKMKDLEVNNKGKDVLWFENKNFFRKGEIGDWVNHFQPWMEEKLSKVIEEKLGGYDFSV